MSARHVADAMALTLPPPVKLTAIMLARHANTRDICWPLIRTLCAETGLCRRTVINSINYLIEGGLLLKREHRRPNGSRSSDVYTLLFPACKVHKVHHDRVSDMHLDQGAPYAPLESMREGAKKERALRGRIVSSPLRLVRDHGA